MRKFFTFFAVLFIAVAAYATEAQRLYLKPGIWYYEGNQEKFAIYSWADGKEAAWSEFMVLAENETDIWTGTIPADHDHLIFVRFGNAATTPSWEDNMWNKTFDLEIVEGKDMYSITGWGEGEGAPCTGEWSKYEPTPKFYIAGDNKLVGEEKAWQSDGLKVMENSYTFKDLAAGNYQFKITVDGTWSTVKGFEDLTPESRAAELYLNGGNIGFTLSKVGDVTITYIKNEVFKVEGDFVLPQLQLIGIKGWDGDKDAIDFVPADNHLTASVKLTLDTSYYEFKLIYAASWIGKKTGDDPKSLYVLKNDWASVDGLTWDGYNIVLKMDEEDVVPGDYTFTWTYATGVLAVTFPSKYTLEDGYYLVGDFGDVPAWGVEDLNPTKKFKVNPGDDKEYMLEHVTLIAEDSLKVASVKKDIIEWYAPDAANYVVDADHAGADKTVYFRPAGDGGEGWWYNCIYVEANSGTAIDNTDAAAKATKVVRNGMLLIEKNGHVYNVLGTMVK